MAISKSAVNVLTSASIAAGGTKASPQTGGTGSSVDVRSYYGGVITWRILNGASAPGVAMTITFQVSGDGSTWRDYYSVGGDTTSSSDNSGTIKLDKDVMYLRALAYGNTTNAVTAAAELEATTGL